MDGECLDGRVLVKCLDGGVSGSSGGGVGGEGLKVVGWRGYRLNEVECVGA